jgi:hypothetical protein
VDPPGQPGQAALQPVRLLTRHLHPEYRDISNPAFRRHWIAEAKAELRHGYRGRYVDDVNMAFRVGNGQEEQVAPIDHATHQPMTYGAWRSYMARFMEQIRAALPHKEIVHNAIWFADSPTLAADPYIRREIKAANNIYLERGVNGSGLTGGSGRYSLSRFLAYIDVVHALGKGVTLGGDPTDRQGSEYSLASYFLISTGKDAVSAAGMTPVHWWSSFEVNLGKALGPRRKWSGVLRRDFTGGMSLVNEPEGEMVSGGRRGRHAAAGGRPRSRPHRPPASRRCAWCWSRPLTSTALSSTRTTRAARVASSPPTRAQRCSSTGTLSVGR